MAQIAYFQVGDPFASLTFGPPVWKIESRLQGARDWSLASAAPTVSRPIRGSGWPAAVPAALGAAAP